MRVHRRKVILAVVGFVCILLALFVAYMCTYNAVGRLDIDGKKFTSLNEVGDYIDEIKEKTCKVSIMSGGNKISEQELKINDFCKFRDKQDILDNIEGYVKDNKIKLAFSNGVKYECSMYEVDNGKIEAKADEIIGEYSKEKIDNKYSIKGDKLVIKTGQSGISFDRGNVVETLKRAIEDSGNSDFIIIANTDEFKETPEKISIMNSKEPVNAGVEKSEGVTKIVYTQDGVKIDAEKIKKALGDYSENTEVTVDIEKIEPDKVDVNTDGLFNDILGEYSTSGFGGSGRAENIRLAAKYINNKILNPGEVFSYCDNVGRTTAERGFKMATVYSNGKAVPGMGGGICQVSSTLYNAVLKANLELVQRVNHSLPVHYVPWGLDATVSSGNPDFKFKNNKNSPIKVEAMCNNGRLTIRILGVSTGENVEVWSEKSSSQGNYVTYKTYKKVTKDGNVVYNGYLNSSTYKIK